MSHTSVLYAESALTRTVEREFSLAGQRKVEIETPNGDIRIRPAAGSTMQLMVIYTVTGSNEEKVRDMLDRCTTEVSLKTSTVKIEPDLPKKRRYKVAASYDLYLPAGLELSAECVNGELDADSLTARVKLETVNGDIDCRRSVSDVEASTINGTIRLSDVGGKIEAQTINGSIFIGCGAPYPKEIDLGAVNGALELRLRKSDTAQPDAVITADSINGPITLTGSTSVQNLKAKRHLETTLGEGRGKYSLDTINGGIRIVLEE
ncbi:MAG: hypothetical protein FJY67_07975 [Calditrichaeota bacterium]|nr:hypothetical protein [Calditrichota bacterium]